MGGCMSKEKEAQQTRMQRPSLEHRRSITYAKPRDICENEEALRRYHTIDETKQLQVGGLKLRYGFMSQRGYYPDDENKPNQDTFSVVENFAKRESDAFFAVYDGHGRDGDKCAQFSRDHLPQILSQQIWKAKLQQLSKVNIVDPDADAISSVELNKLQVQNACTKSHLKVNSAMHLNDQFEDALSGTTAISAYIQGRRNRVTISNVGDSRAILGKRIKQDGEENVIPHDENAEYRAFPLSKDQTPYRKFERKRIRACGARILSLDQIEGLEPVSIDEYDEDDFELGEEIDEGGDPPRVWHATMDYPGTAFTRSLGDALAEELGVIAEPEMLTRELEEGDEIIVLASDGVFEFLTNQSVIDICAKFSDPLEACRAVISESYELWLQYELRTDDITMICIFIDDINNQAPDSTISRASAVDTEKDLPDNVAMEATSEKKDSGKLNKRLTEMKQLLEESLLDAPNKGEEFDFKKLYNEKTKEQLDCLSEAIKGSVMLQSLTKQELDFVYGVMQSVEVKKGDFVIRQGEEGDRFYIVEHGKFEVRISSDTPGRGQVRGDGEIVHVYEGSKKRKLHPSFGELALLYSAPRAASIIAQTDGKLWALDRGALKSIMLDNSGKKELVSVLRSIEELEEFKDEEIEYFATSMGEETFPKGEIITVANDIGTALYVISKGNCVINLDASGEKLSSTLKKLDYFGQEVMMAKNGHYLTTVEALTETKCWKLEKNVIAHSMKKLNAVREGRSTV